MKKMDVVKVMLLGCSLVGGSEVFAEATKSESRSLSNAASKSASAAAASATVKIVDQGGVNAADSTIASHSAIEKNSHNTDVDVTKNSRDSHDMWGNSDVNVSGNTVMSNSDNTTVINENIDEGPAIQRTAQDAAPGTPMGNLRSPIGPAALPNAAAAALGVSPSDGGGSNTNAAPPMNSGSGGGGGGDSGPRSFSDYQGNSFQNVLD